MPPSLPPFIDRDAELAALGRRLAQPSSLSLVYGQRRTGKTFLLQHLLRDRPDAVSFLADETTAPALLRRFHEHVHAMARGGPAWSAIAPADWGRLLDVLFEEDARAGRDTVLVLDELQYLLAVEPAFPSILQRLWDGHHRKKRIHLLLCGSALGTLARLGDAGQPLHGRFDLRLKLQPFRYDQAAGFAPRWSRTDRLRLYGVLGGLARHLAEVDARGTLEECVERAVLDPLGPLHEAPLDVLRTEHFSNAGEAYAVLAAIADGENRFTAIASRTGLAASRLDYVVKELSAVDLLEREARFGDRPGSKYARYRATDPFSVFWFRFVMPNRSALVGTSPRRIWTERIAPHLDGHMGRAFEQIVRQAVASGRLAAKLGVVDESLPFWTRDGQHEIDLVVRGGRQTWAFECKWRATGSVDVPDLDRLKLHVAALGARATTPRLALATAGRFTKRLERAAADEGVLLVGARDLLD